MPENEQQFAQLTNKAFENIELSSVDAATDKSTVTEDLVVEISTILNLSENEQVLRDNMERHTQRSDYNDEVIALHAVILPYLKQCTVESERKAIATKIFEGAKNCTEGYANRLTEVHLSISYVFDIPHILQAIRHSLAEKAAANVNTSNDVHVRNRFFIVGHETGLGLLSREDIYPGDISDEVIISFLESIFMADYKPFSIMEQIYEELLARFRCEGYEGAIADTSNESYKEAQYESWRTSIKGLLPHLGDLKLDDFLRIQEIEDEDEITHYYIRDLNLDFIRKKLFEHLASEYFALDARLQEVMTKLFSTSEALHLTKDDIDILIEQPELHSMIRVLDEAKQQTLIGACMDAAVDNEEKSKYSALFLPSFPNKIAKSRFSRLLIF